MRLSKGAILNQKIVFYEKKRSTWGKISSGVRSQVLRS